MRGNREQDDEGQRRCRNAVQSHKGSGRDKPSRGLSFERATCYWLRIAEERWCLAVGILFSLSRLWKWRVLWNVICLVLKAHTHTYVVTHMYTWIQSDKYFSSSFTKNIFYGGRCAQFQTITVKCSMYRCISMCAWPDKNAWIQDVECGSAKSKMPEICAYKLPLTLRSVYTLLVCVMCSYPFDPMFADILIHWQQSVIQVFSLFKCKSLCACVDEWFWSI